MLIDYILYDFIALIFWLLNVIKTAQSRTESLYNKSGAKPTDLIKT